MPRQNLISAESWRRVAPTRGDRNRQPAAEAHVGSLSPWIGSRAKCLILKADGMMGRHRIKSRARSIH